MAGIWLGKYVTDTGVVSDKDMDHFRNSVRQAEMNNRMESSPETRQHQEMKLAVVNLLNHKAEGLTQQNQEWHGVRVAQGNINNRRRQKRNTWVTYIEGKCEAPGPSTSGMGQSAIFSPAHLPFVGSERRAGQKQTAFILSNRKKLRPSDVG